MMKTIIAWLGVFLIVVVGPSLAGAASPSPNPKSLAKRLLALKVSDSKGTLLNETEIDEAMEKLDGTCYDTNDCMWMHDEMHFTECTTLSDFGLTKCRKSCHKVTASCDRCENIASDWMCKNLIEGIKMEQNTSEEHEEMTFEEKKKDFCGS